MSSTPRQGFSEIDPKYIVGCPQPRGFVPPKNFTEFDARYGAYPTIGGMMKGIRVGDHWDDLRQETVIAVMVSHVIEDLYPLCVGKSEKDFRNMLCRRVKHLAMTQRRRQFYSDQYRDKRLNSKEKITARFEPVEQEQTDSDGKGMALDERLSTEGFRPEDIVTAHQFEESTLFDFSLAQSRPDLVEILAASKLGDCPELKPEKSKEIKRSFAAWKSDGHIPTSKKNPGTSTREHLKKLMIMGGYDAHLNGMTYEFAHFLKMLPRPIKNELRDVLQNCVDVFRTANPFIPDASQPKALAALRWALMNGFSPKNAALLGPTLLIEHFLEDPECPRAWVKQFALEDSLSELINLAEEGMVNSGMRHVWDSFVKERLAANAAEVERFFDEASNRANAAGTLKKEEPH